MKWALLAVLGAVLGVGATITTVKGCTCQSACGPFGRTDGTSWCVTQTGCGTYNSAVKLYTDSCSPCPGCASSYTASSGPVLDQGYCGSCYAFSAATVTAAHAGYTSTAISPQNIVSCNAYYTPRDETLDQTPYDNGCDGGIPVQMLDFLEYHGAATCTLGCTAGCVPYVSGTPTSTHACASYTDCYVPACPTRCASGSQLSAYTHHANSPWCITFNQYWQGIEATIRYEILQHGPVSATFMVYDDFFTFFKNTPGGIYTSTAGVDGGGHAVVIVGWGSTAGQNYWLVQNSWNTDWGVGGFFKIARGSNFCGIEQEICTISSASRRELNGGSTTQGLTFTINGVTYTLTPASLACIGTCNLDVVCIMGCLGVTGSGGFGSGGLSNWPRAGGWHDREDLAAPAAMAAVESYFTSVGVATGVPLSNIVIQAASYQIVNGVNDEFTATATDPSGTVYQHHAVVHRGLDNGYSTVMADAPVKLSSSWPIGIVIAVSAGGAVFVGAGVAVLLFLWARKRRSRRAAAAAAPATAAAAKEDAPAPAGAQA